MAGSRHLDFFYHRPGSQNLQFQPWLGDGQQLARYVRGALERKDLFWLSGRLEPTTLSVNSRAWSDRGNLFLGRLLGRHQAPEPVAMDERRMGKDQYNAANAFVIKGAFDTPLPRLLRIVKRWGLPAELGNRILTVHADFMDDCREDVLGLQRECFRRAFEELQRA